MKRIFAWMFLPVIALLISQLMGCEDHAEMRRVSSGKLAVKGQFLFAKTAPGKQTTRSVTLENVGQEILTLAEFGQQMGKDFTLAWSILASDGKTVEAGRAGLPGTVYIGPGEQLRLSLSYRPTTSKIPTGRIHFRTNSGAKNQGSISLPIGGLLAAGELLASTSELNFGRVALGQSRSKSVFLFNSGSDTVHLQSLSVHGASAFKIQIRGEDAEPGSNILQDPDGDGEPGLLPDAQVEVQVVFQSNTQNPALGELVVESDGRPRQLRVGLLANGAGPCVRVTPALVDFPPTAIGAERAVSLRIESCGTEAVAIEEIILTDENEVFTLPEPLALPTQVGGRHVAFVETIVRFKPSATQAYLGGVLVKTSDAEIAEIEVPLAGRGVENTCPIPRVVDETLNVRPLDVATLDGSDSLDVDGPDGRPVAYEWSVVERPRGSTSQPVETMYDPYEPSLGGDPDRTATPRAQFFVDLAGDYVVELRVTDHYGAAAPSELCPAQPARVRIRAIPDEKFHVQLTWDTPGDADQTDDLGTDVDLHLRHPSAGDWFTGDGLDCYFQNQSPDWGRPGQTADDPSLDIDDVNGAGPENINIDRPENTDGLGGGYGIGVHYYSAEAPTSEFDFSALESTARLRVFIDGQVAWEAERLLSNTNDFWHAADVHFSGSGSRVEPVDSMGFRSP